MNPTSPVSPAKPMRGAVIRLVLVAALFLLWLGYLAYLVAITPRPAVILSRPQFLVADVVVIARVDDPAGPVRVEEVITAPEALRSALAGASLAIPNLAACRPLRHPSQGSSPRDFTGPGSYILPLRRQPGAETGEPSFEAAPTPPSPGYPTVGPPEWGPPRIYPATPETRFQLEHMRSAVGR